MHVVAGVAGVEPPGNRYQILLPLQWSISAYSEKLIRAFASPTCLSIRSRETARSFDV